MTRHAQILEDYTCSEPIPLIDFYISRARVLAIHGNEVEAGYAHHELQRLQKRGRNVGPWNALEAVEAALAAAKKREMTTKKQAALTTDPCREAVVIVDLPGIGWLISTTGTI